MGQGFAGDSEQYGVNNAPNASIHEIDGGRRHVLRCTTAAVALLMGSHTLTGHAATVAKGKPLGFTSVPVSSADALIVPPEYEAQVLYRWGDRVRPPLSSGARMAVWSEPSTATQKYRNMKARLRTHGGVATLAKAHSLRCGLRLALGTKPSLSLCFATSGLQY